jgi:hypothetical protein
VQDCAKAIRTMFKLQKKHRTTPCNCMNHWQELVSCLFFA